MAFPTECGRSLVIREGVWCGCAWLLLAAPVRSRYCRARRRPCCHCDEKSGACASGGAFFHTLHLEKVIRDHDILILGETGTGKELVAAAIQAGTLGPDDGSPAPSAAINAAAVPETLLESELFGHTKGAFTGANEARVGSLRSAHHGSIFLDEVGDLRATTQVALLRVMETDEVRPLGSDKTYQADVRYIAATHADLRGQVRDGSFRQDLFQRLAGNVIQVPALRERPEDIVAIGEAFVKRHVPTTTAAVDRPRLTRWLAESARSKQAWPGNVRQLENALRDLMLGLPPAFDSTSDVPVHSEAPEPSGREIPTGIREGAASLATLNRWYLDLVLARHDGNVSEAARVLEVDRTTIYRWLKHPLNSGDA